jgi:hypothetical protein
VVREVPGLTAVDAPAAGRGLSQFDGIHHGFLFEANPTAARAQAQIGAFLRSHFDTGTGIIEAP